MIFLLLALLVAVGIVVLATYVFGWVDPAKTPGWSIVVGFALAISYSSLFLVMGQSMIEDVIVLVLTLVAAISISTALSHPVWIKPMAWGVLAGGLSGFTFNRLAMFDPRPPRSRPSRLP